MRVLGALQALVRAHDADVIPHAAADFVPVVRHDDHFVRVVRVAGLPGRDLEVGGPAAGWPMTRLRGAMGADQRLQQRIAGQAVGAVQARCRPPRPRRRGPAMSVSPSTFVTTPPHW